MRPGRLRRRGLARLRSLVRLPSPRDDGLLASTGEFEANDRKLHDLLARDGRDAGDVPGFDDLADRRAELVELIVATPARSLAGTVAKARCARLRPSEQGFDAALDLALSACDDLLRLAGARRTRGAAVRTVEPAGSVRRLAIFRHSDLWRHLVDTSIQVGAWSLAGATVLPLDGVHLRWTVVALLLAGGGSATFLASWLRDIDRPR